jgi:aryl-alcohol dehydrogenase-like predicted oxidoreductase
MSKKDVSAREAGDVSLGGQLSVPRLGFGAMRITGEGIFGPPKDRQGALAVLRRAVELGVRFIDTADSYGPGVSEELISEALFPYPRILLSPRRAGGFVRGRINGRTMRVRRIFAKRSRAASRDCARIALISINYMPRIRSCLSRTPSRLWLSCNETGRFV